jgi:lyso-ornithine lipid O-acyltransferase
MSTASVSFHPQVTGAPGATFETRLRQVARTIGFCALLFAAALELGWLHLLRRAETPMARALWLQRLCRRLARLLDLRTRYSGEPAASGLLVFNHVSYLDIITLSSRHPVVFVAKQEVRGWPVIGWIAACAGTVFIDRNRRSDVARITETMRGLLAEGIRVCIFPEGTSSDGSRVLPFRTSLLEPAIAGGQPVTAGWVGYALEDGDAGTEVCYWGDLTFGPHLLNLFSKRCIFGSVAYAPAGVAAAGCRKAFGEHLHALVCDLAKQQA